MSSNGAKPGSVGRDGGFALCVALALLATGCQPESPKTTQEPSSSPVTVAKQSPPSARRTLLDAPRKPSEADDQPIGPAWFTDLTEATEIDFRHVTGNSAERPFPAANGSGAATFDYDLDGHYDVLFCTGVPFPLDPKRESPHARCFRNTGGWHFRDVTAPTGLGHNGFSAGVAVGDFDSDGFPDVFLACFGPDVLFHNLGDGTFERVEQAAHVDSPLWSTSAAFFDYDHDGLLDLYVCNYAIWTFEKNPYCGDPVRKIRMHCGPRSVPPEPDNFYRNDGDGRFHDVRKEAGIGAQDCRGQGVVAADLNGDGWTDLYVGNDLQPNFLFLGEPGGKFRDATESSGAAYDANGAVQASMGVDIADINRDGKPEIFTTNFQLETNALYDNLGEDAFLEATSRYGLAADSLVYVGWGTQFVDFDLDGWLDLIVSNGHVDDNRHEIGENAPYEQPPLLYRHDTNRFQLITRQGGSYFQKPHCGRGVAVCDLDNDGDMDLVITHQDQRPGLLRNDRLPRPADDPRSAAASITVKLIGVVSNRDAVGAALTLRSGLGTQYSQVKGGGSYLSASDLRQVFAVPPTGDTKADADDKRDDGKSSPPIELEIRWPSGRVTQVPGLAPGQRLLVREPASADQDVELFPLPE